MLYVQITFTNFSVLYFVILVFIGSFFLLNLALATIIVKYNQKKGSSDKKTTDEALAEKQKAIKTESNIAKKLARGNLIEVPFSYFRKQEFEKYLEIANVNRSRKHLSPSHRPSVSG